MNNLTLLKKRLFSIIGGVVILFMVLSVAYSASILKIEKEQEMERYTQTLRVYMQRMEESMDSVENLLITQCTNISLQAVTSDPDGDYVKVSWSEYIDAETYAGEAIALKGADSDIVTFTVPADAKSGDTIHIIAKASDDVTNSLSHYQRVIITVK